MTPRRDERQQTQFRLTGTHHSGNDFELGSAIVLDPTSSIAVRHTSTLSAGITNVLDSRKKSPPFALTIGVVVVIVRA